jgi:hypothetical protein
MYNIGKVPTTNVDTDEVSQYAEPGPNFIFGVLAGSYWRKMGRRLDFNE